MAFGGGGGQDSDDAMNQLVNSTMMTWITDVLNQQRQTAAADEQAQALAGQRGAQQGAVTEAQRLQSEQEARDAEWRQREEAMLGRMNDMQADFASRMQAQSEYEKAAAERDQAERARLAEEAKREKILADQKKQDELRDMRGRLWAGGFEGTKMTGGLGDTSKAETQAGKLLGSAGQLPTEGDPTNWAGDGNPTTTVRGGKGQGILGLLTPPGMKTDDWLKNWVGVLPGQKPAASWVNEQYSAKVLGGGR